MRDDRESGQMMLLGAIVLIVGFLILSIIVARISQVPNETAQDTGGILREAAAVERGVRALDTDTSVGTADFLPGLGHLAAMEESRGYFLSVPTSCTGGKVTLSLAGIGGRVVMQFSGLATSPASHCP